MIPSEEEYLEQQTRVKATLLILEYNLVGEREATINKAKFVYLYRPGIDRPYAFIDRESVKLYFYLHDALGSITGIVDINTNIVQTYSYDAFGNPQVFDKNGNQVAIEDAPIKNRLLFTGREYDFETGMYYYRARYYDSSVGRFISRDPIGFDGGDLNLYRYVLNRPTVLTDPTGNNPLAIFNFTKEVIKGIFGFKILSGLTGGTGLNAGEDKIIERIRSEQKTTEILPPNNDFNILNIINPSPIDKNQPQLKPRNSCN